MNRSWLPVLLLLASCSRSGPPDIQISDAWARETVSGQGSTAVYMILENKGSGDDRLLDVSAQPPAKAMLHSSESSGGISRMRPMPSGLAVPAGASIELKPGGSHVMVMGLGAPLRAGEKLKLTARFEKSGERPVDARVISASGAGAR